MADGWFYKIVACFPLTGFLGIDKLVLRSPSTAFLKFLINIFFLGAWYVYDCIQVFTDADFVGKYGFSAPYGASGHGYRFLSGISESKIDEFGTASKYNGGVLSNVLFLLFAGLTFFFGFSGLPMMLAGDFNGGLIKLFSNFLILPFIFYLFTQIFDFFKSGPVQKEGITHPWPMFPMLTIFEKYPATTLLSKDEGKAQLDAHLMKYDADIKSGKLPLIPEMVMMLFGKAYEAASLYPPIAAFDTLTAGKGAVSASSDMAQSAAKVGAKLATAMEKRISQDPNAVIDKILGPAENAADPAIVANNALVKGVQKGGGLDIIPEGLDTLMLVGMGVLIAGGLTAALLRKFSLPRRQEDNEYPRKVYERDDSPPQPGRV